MWFKPDTRTRTATPDSRDTHDKIIITIINFWKHRVLCIFCKTITIWYYDGMSNLIIHNKIISFVIKIDRYIYYDKILIGSILLECDKTHSIIYNSWCYIYIWFVVVLVYYNVYHVWVWSFKLIHYLHNSKFMINVRTLHQSIFLVWSTMINS